MSVMFRVRLCRFGRVVRSMVQMSLGRMCVVSRELMFPCLVMSCGFAMVAYCMLKVLSRFVMMFCRFLGHLFPPRRISPFGR